MDERGTGPVIEVVRGDIVALDTDAIVNAANEGLWAGSGVCGAIHAAAGPGLAEECAGLGGCPTGDARTTSGHRLTARWVIHAVGPRWSGGDRGEADLLASAYRRSLAEADRVGARSIAFPAISTGVYGYPKDEAARVAVTTLRSTPTRVERIVLCAFGEDDEHRYRGLLAGG